jgi:hypothetical protein
MLLASMTEWPEDLLFAMFCLCMNEMQRRWPEAYKEAASMLPPPGPELEKLGQAMDDAFFAATPSKGRA